MTIADIRAAQAGDAAATDRIIRELTPNVEAMARDYFYPGAEREDVVQWGWLGVLGGLRAFETNRSDQDPRAFLLMCARRWMQSGLKVQTRHRAQALNHAVRSGVGEDGDEIAMTDLLADPAADIVELLALQQELRELADEVARLSPLERRAVLGLAYGYSYAEIEGVDTSTAAKQVDNALMRARNKLRVAAKLKDAA